MNATQQELTIEGVTYVVLKRNAGDPANGTGIGYHYSLDNGETWHPQLNLAFVEAKRTDKLTVISEPVSEGGEYEAFALALFQETGKLVPGERLILTKTDTQTVVLKESVVLAVRNSVIDDMQLEEQQ